MELFDSSPNANPTSEKTEATAGSDKILSSKFSRAIKTTSIAAKSGVKHLNYLKNKALTSESDSEGKAKLKLEHEADIGRILFTGLSQMRGTALKASQLLSLEADLLPEGIRQELAKSCYQVPPINRALVRKVFIQEFGKDAGKIFHTFEAQAWAAASLGQVHKAIITHSAESTSAEQSHHVAVKVQYPGIGESIDSDLKILRFILAGLSKTTSHMPNKHVLETTLSEIEHCLTEEINYEKEADNTRWFAENLTLSNVRVPKVFDEYSTKRILTTEFLTGLHVEDWLKTQPTQEQRNRAGQTIFELFIHSAFELRTLHADPHMGNYLFLENGDIGLIDFGCVKQLTPSFTQKMSRMISAILDGNQKQVLQGYKELEILVNDLPFAQYMEEIYPLLGPLQDWMSTPYNAAHACNKDGSPLTTNPNRDENYFDFSTLPPPPTEMSPANHKTAMTSLHSLTREQPYFDRSYFGVYQLLRKMKAVVNTKNPWIKQTHGEQGEAQ